MSIRLRLLLAGLLILPVFLGLTGLLLDRAFNRYQLQTQQEAQRLQLLLLARAADWQAAESGGVGHWQVEGLDEARFLLPDSGLYAFIADPAGPLRWSSDSAQSLLEQAGTDLRETVAGLAGEVAEIGASYFAPCHLQGDYFCSVQRVAWGSEGPQALFLVIESAEAVAAARRAYRGQIAALAAAVTLLLLLAQALVAHWGMQPLRRVATTIRKLETGEAQGLEGSYPAELRPLTDNLVQLLSSERRRRERVRNTMDRLTHVLRSPLMLIRNSPDEGAPYRALVEQQVERMLGIVEGELARARLDGRQARILGSPVPVAPVLERIVQAYGRLPRPPGMEDKPLLIDTGGVHPGARLAGDERDLQDLFGTLLENALKYARGRIEVSAENLPGDNGEELRLSVADDGEGIPAGLESLILERGARADTVNLGQGLGLAIVVEIVSAYGGSLRVGRAAMGGALFEVYLPA